MTVTHRSKQWVNLLSLHKVSAFPIGVTLSESKTYAIVKQPLLSFLGAVVLCTKKDNRDHSLLSYRW